MKKQKLASAAFRGNPNYQRRNRGVARWLLRLLRKNGALWCLLCLVAILYLRLITTYHPDAATPNSLSAAGDSPWNRNGKDRGVAACLLIMDDNHFLVEWLAYHYHSAGLRKLVVAVDPKSTTSPLEILGRWKERMDITVWTKDADYLAPEEFEAAQEAIGRTFRETTPSLIEHRARQRLFYTHCLRSLKQDSEASQLQSQSTSTSQSAWTMLVDVDEFVRVNSRTAKAWSETSNDLEGLQPFLRGGTMGQPGSVARVLQVLASPASGKTVESSSQPPPWDGLRSSPCIPLPRLRFISQQDKEGGQREHETHNSTSFVTQTYRAHARGDDKNRNKISKTMIDLSRVPLEDIVDVDSIHMPIRKYCSQRNLYYAPKDSLLVVNHYLGSYEQFTYRENDARNGISKPISSTDSKATETKVNVRNAHHFQKQQQFQYAPETDDEIKPWLEGFANHQNKQAAKELLKDSGQLAPKSWRRIFHSNNNSTVKSDRCALLFFGLTRSYQEMVLPSLIENVLKPNARHGCDVYVHFYKQDTEAPGRRNDGGKLRPDEIFLLEDAVHAVSKDYYENVLLEREYKILADDAKPEYAAPIVAFSHDTPEEFLERRSSQLTNYHEKTKVNDSVAVPAYFPYKAKSYTRESLDNLVRQWHSIQSAFQLMDFTSKQQKISYTRVGMFRSDCLYVTPIDIASIGSSKSTGDDSATTEIPLYDVNNQFFVTPSFALHPVNDRLVYGPYEAVKVWATKRFDLVEESARLQITPGYTMHSERFLNASIFPAMEKLGFGHISNGEICFLRTRVGEMAFVNDCSIDGILPTPQTIDDWNKKPSDEMEEHRLSLVEAIVKQSCTLTRMSNNRKWTIASCGKA